MFFEKIISFLANETKVVYENLQNFLEEDV